MKWLSAGLMAVLLIGFVSQSCGYTSMSMALIVFLHPIVLVNYGLGIWRLCRIRRRECQGKLPFNWFSDTNVLEPLVWRDKALIAIYPGLCAWALTASFCLQRLSCESTVLVVHSIFTTAAYIIACYPEPNPVSQKDEHGARTK